MTDRIQFREDEDVIAFVESQGINPNMLARELFEAEVRRMRARYWYERVREAGIRLPCSGAEIIREERESH